MKPKLLVLTSTFPRWPDDTDPPFIYELSRRLTDRFEVTVHAPHYPGAKTRETMDDIRIHRFRYFLASLERLAGSTGILPTLRHNRLYYGLVPFFLLAQFCSIMLLVRRLRPDVIHAHWLIPQGFFAVAVKRLFDVPVVVTAHGTDIFGLRQRLFIWMKRFAGTGADSVTVVSSALRDNLTETLSPGKTIEIIPMGVNADRFKPERRYPGLRKRYGMEGPFLLFVGRLTVVKGVEYLIDAMPSVLCSQPNAKLLLVGNGELLSDLRHRVQTLDLEDRVVFTGSVPNAELPAYYATADIFLGPSIQEAGGDREGFGLTFVEAAMSGCLVIGTNTGGIGDIILDGKTGFLVPEKDPKALAETILYSLKHQQKVGEITKTARQRCVRKYDWPVIASRYEMLFLQWLEVKEV